MKTFVTFLLLVLVVVDGQKNGYVSIFKRKHLFPVFVFYQILELLKRGLWENLMVFLAIYEGTCCKKGL